MFDVRHSYVVTTWPCHGEEAARSLVAHCVLRRWLRRQPWRRLRRRAWRTPPPSTGMPSHRANPVAIGRSASATATAADCNSFRRSRPPPAGLGRRVRRPAPSKSGPSRRPCAAKALRRGRCVARAYSATSSSPLPTGVGAQRRLAESAPRVVDLNQLCSTLVSVGAALAASLGLR